MSVLQERLEFALKWGISESSARRMLNTLKRFPDTTEDAIRLWVADSKKRAAMCQGKKEAGSEKLKPRRTA